MFAQTYLSKNSLLELIKMILEFTLSEKYDNYCIILVNKFKEKDTGFYVGPRYITSCVKVDPDEFALKEIN